MTTAPLAGWGRHPVRDCRLETLREARQLGALLDAAPTLIPRGGGRAYGDAALNPALTLSMLAQDRLLHFDADNGRLTCEAGVTLADLQPTPQGLFREDALRVAALMEYEIDESLGKSGVVEVELESGETLVERVDAPLGHRDNPLGAAERRRKFRDCAVHAAASLDDDAIGEIIAAAERLDALPDAAALLPLLRGERA